MSAPFRYALVGAGHASRQLHAPAFINRPESLELAAFCDPHPEARATFAAEHPGARAFATHTDLIRGAGFDAAIVTLPHHLHYPIACDFIEAGIPVLVEKPVACSLAELRDLCARAERRRVPVAAGQNRRFNRDATWIREWVRADPQHFGALRTFDLQAWQNVLAYTGGPGKASHWILDQRTAGGGVVLSLAIHQLDFVRHVFGVDYSEVVAHGRFDPPFRGGAESCATAWLRTSNGGSGTLHAQYTAPRVPYCEALSAFGEHGTVVQALDRPFTGAYEGSYYYASDPGDTTAWPHQFEGFSRVDPSLVASLDPHSFTNQALAFADSVRRGTPPLNSLRNNFNTLATVFAIYDSIAAGGRPVPVPAE